MSYQDYEHEYERRRQARRAAARRGTQRRQVHRRRRLVALGVLVLAAVGVAVVVAQVVGGGGDATTAAGTSGGGGTSSGGGGGESGDEGAPGQPGGKPVTLTIEANGDLLIHSPIFQLANQYGGGSSYDFRPMLKQVKPTVQRADLAVCHVETPMTDGPPQGYPVFKTPADLAKAIKWAGWDACDTASNHSLDAGQEGVDFTGKALDAQGVKHTGSFPSAAAQGKPLILEAKGVKVAWIACTEMTNGIPPPNPYSVNVCKADELIAMAKKARKAGAQAVFVNVHGGTEYQSEPSAWQKGLAGKLTRSPYVTAVVGQHVHVVQPIRKVNGKFVVFGEGNLLSNQTAGCCPASSQDGYMALLTVTVKDGKAKVTKVRYVPVFVVHPNYVVQPVGPGSQGELKASYDRTVAVAGKGAAKPQRAN